MSNAEIIGMVVLGCAFITMAVKLILFGRIVLKWTKKKNAYASNAKKREYPELAEWVEHHAFDMVDAFYISKWTERDYVNNTNMWKQVNHYWNKNQ